MNSKVKGERTEGIILAALLRKGLSVSIPFGSSQRYDFIIDDGEKLLKVQCKTGRLISGCVFFNVTSVNGFTHKKTGYQGQIDLFMIHCPHNDTLYSVPIALCGKSEFCLRIDPPKRGSGKIIHWAKDFLL